MTTLVEHPTNGQDLGKTNLSNLPLVPLIGTRDIVGQRLRTSEVVVAAGRGNDVALAGDLPGESGYRTGDCETMLVCKNSISGE